jgi:uncharacterized protein
MPGEKDIDVLLKTMWPKLNAGEFVFCTSKDAAAINPADILMAFKEQEGNTFILKKELADGLQLDYAFVASWITLTVHSSLEAVGLTATFSTALANEGISCNVVAAFYHDHIFVAIKDTAKAMEILNRFCA